jgi:hypothetical protein
VVVPFCCSRVTKATMDVAVSDTCQIQWGTAAAAPDCEANRDFCMVRHTVGGIIDWFAGRTNASVVVVYLSLLLPWTVWLGSSSLAAALLHANGVVDSTTTDDDEPNHRLRLRSMVVGRRCVPQTSRSWRSQFTHKGYAAHQKCKTVSFIFEIQAFQSFQDRADQDSMVG